MNMKLLASLGALALLATAAHAETIKVGIDNESYPPFYSKNASGNWEGWEIDLLHSVCDQLKATCELEPVAWDGLIPALVNKKIDLIWSSMTINAEREKVISFTAPYYNYGIVMIGAKSDTTAVDCNKLSSFKGKVVGVQAGSIYASFFAAHPTDGVTVKSYDTLDNALADLNSGRVDYVQEADTSFADFLSKNSDFEQKTVCAGDPILGYGTGGGVRIDDVKLRDEVTAAIKATLANGEWDKITAKYPAIVSKILKP